MKFTLALLGLAASVFASPPGGVATGIAPSSGPPSGCTENYSGVFAISTAENPSKRELNARQAGNALTLTLHNGILRDPTTGRIGYIASNYQFQFDNPPQAGAIYTGGFSVCANMTLALGDSAEFIQCTNGSGDRNLYFEQGTGLECKPIFIVVIPTGQSSGQVVSTPAPNSRPASSKPFKSTSALPPSTTAPSTPISTPASTPASSPASSPASMASSPVSSPAPTPVPVATGGTGSVAPAPTSSPPSTPVPAPPNAADKTLPQVFALALGVFGAALL